MSNQGKLYLFIRSDLPPGLVVAQACHVAMAAVKAWELEPDNTIVVLDGGRSESDLLCYADRLTWWIGDPLLWEEPKIKNDDYVVFTEPDLNNEHTGFAIKPGLVPNWILSMPLLFGEGVTQ